MIRVSDYWPFFAQGARRFDYSLPDSEKIEFSSVFSYDRDTQSMLYKDFDADGKWLDTWYFQQRPGVGVAEWRDDYPGKRKVFCEPIGWGDWADVGSVYSNEPRVDIFRTWPPTLPLTGSQFVSFEGRLDKLTLRDGAEYLDVLQFVYFQKWGTFGGARYFNARGVGPVALEWLAPDIAANTIHVSDRYEAVVTERA